MGESFSPAVVAKLNETWLPYQAGKPSCLSLLNCLTTIIPHWMFLTEDEIERGKYHGEGPTPESDPVRARQLASGKIEWLRVRLPELLKRLDQPVEWCAFLKDIDVSDRSCLPSIWTNRSIDRIPQKIEEGIDGLQRKLLEIGQEEKELPKGWETTGWNYYRLGIQPVRDIPELISHLRQRAEYVSSTVQNPFERPQQRSDVLRLTLRNAQHAIQELISDPERWPACDCSSNDFQQSQLQLGELIRKLSVIAAQDAKAEPPKPGETLAKVDVAGGGQGKTDDKKKAVIRAVGVYEWAISNIPDADAMTIQELFEAIQIHPDMKSDYLAVLPNNHKTFGTYLRRGGIKRYNVNGDRQHRQSRRPKKR